jgi:hypothetical protein
MKGTILLIFTLISILTVIDCCQQRGSLCSSDSDCCTHYCRFGGCDRRCEDRNLLKLDEQQCQKFEAYCTQDSDCCNGQCRASRETFCEKPYDLLICN